MTYASHHHHQQQNSNASSVATNVMIIPEAAPVRCFLNDIPSIIAQHQQTQKLQQQQHHQECCCDSHNVGGDCTFHDRKRRKIDSPKSTLRLRLLGTVINVSSIIMKEDDEEQNQMANENMDVTNRTTINHMMNEQDSHHGLYNNNNHHQGTNYDRTMTLDDGTGTVVSVHITNAMIHKIQLAPGMILDAIVRVDDHATAAAMPPNNTTNGRCYPPSGIRFVADQLVVQDSTTETLRWFELSYQASLKNRRVLDQSHHNHDPTLDPEDHMCDDNEAMIHDEPSPQSSSPSSLPTKPTPYHTAQSSNWMGYPTRDLTSEDIYRIIASECEFAAAANDDDDDPKNSRHSGGGIIIHPSTHRPDTCSTPRRQVGGVSLQDLADCFDYYSTAYIATLVQELQTSGQIYQNENGLYTLL